MTRQVVVRPEAAGDIEDAYNWYERARTGLGEEFLAASSTRSAIHGSGAHGNEAPHGLHPTGPDAMMRAGW